MRRKWKRGGRGIAVSAPGTLAYGHPEGLHVTLLDPDVISPTNCVRQPFSQSEIGLHKSVVLANRLNLFWGLAGGGRRADERYRRKRYNLAVADNVICISEAEAASNFADVLARVRAGAEVVIESGKLPVAVVHAPARPPRTISECIALLPEDSPVVMDADFAKDVKAAIESHREPLEPPA